jgi:tetratricopeptide (TPR) repeat protein
LTFAWQIICLIIPNDLRKMRYEIKIGVYGLLIVLACVFGFLSISNYKRLMTEPQEAAQSAGEAEIPALRTDSTAKTSSGYARMLTYGIFFFASLVGLGVLLGHDVSQHFSNRIVKGIYDDEGEAMANPDYEVAEQEWANGHHLEAIRLMREFLEKNPREQHVAIRIAEIYEKDLNNPLAAALEYEEVLQRKLPPEKWGWSAIHLCNLYSKLGQHEKSIALLKRIDVDYGQTAAAEKARKRLSELGMSRVEEPPPPAQESSPDATGAKLPPGFKLKKT